MLDKYLNVDWEANGKNITTRGGQYLGTATTPELAKVMASTTRVLRLLLSLHKDEKRVRDEIARILAE